ncbi:protein of unknown function [Nitrospina watsonii]|uniref:Uncharacterized protein n=1 Tax=Nitrospina watsonii TaxID=1323948 RepID=A0ABM9HG27_9BACT|nr:protein of unknown function [Nitrospina watsonii]
MPGGKIWPDFPPRRLCPALPRAPNPFVLKEFPPRLPNPAKSLKSRAFGTKLALNPCKDCPNRPAGGPRAGNPYFKEDSNDGFFDVDPGQCLRAECPAPAHGRHRQQPGQPRDHPHAGRRPLQAQGCGGVRQSAG